MRMKAQISLIAAIGQNRELGKHGALLWRIPEDLRRFRDITTGHPIIMGRKTFESIGKPLPGRKNIVVTRDTAYTREGITRAHSLEEAVGEAARSEGADEIFVIGGGELYAQAMGLSSRLYLTLIEATDPDADAYFPEYQDSFTKVMREERCESGGLKYRWIMLEK